MLSLTLAAAAAAVALPGFATAAKTPAGVIAVPLSRDEGLTAYFAKLQVGTPPQTEYLKIDTGSPRYSFMDPRNEVCQRKEKPCSTFGTFNNKTSSYVSLKYCPISATDFRCRTSRYRGHGFQDALGSVGAGDYLSDTVSLGGVTVKDLYFGYTSEYSFADKVRGDANTILGKNPQYGAHPTEKILIDGQ